MLQKQLEELKAERKADTHELETLKRSIAELTNASSEPPQNRSHTVGVVGAYEGAGRIQEQANLTAEISAKRKPTSQERSTTSTSMCLSPSPAKPVKQYKCANPGCNVSMNDRSLTCTNIACNIVSFGQIKMRPQMMIGGTNQRRSTHAQMLVVLFKCVIVLICPNIARTIARTELRLRAPNR